MPKKVFLFGSYSANVLLLDLYPSATAAYSFRKLRTAYTGNCLRVRRLSDNTEQDIGFVSNYIDKTSLSSFVGASNGYITKWYDQSGNGKDATQTSASFQYEIVTSGTILLQDGFVIANLPSGNHRMDIASITSADTYVVHRYALGADGILADYGGGGSAYGLVSQNGSSSTTLTSNIGNPTIYINGTSGYTTRGGIYTALNTASNKTVSMINGSRTSAVQMTFYTGLANYGFRGKVFEWVVYPTTQTGFASIISNQKTYYGIL